MICLRLHQQQPQLLAHVHATRDILVMVLVTVISFDQEFLVII